jgi:hypothetical protein
VPYPQPVCDGAGNIAVQKEVEKMHFKDIFELGEAQFQSVLGRSRNGATRAVLENELRLIEGRGNNGVQVQNGAKGFPRHNLSVVSNFLCATTLLLVLHGSTGAQGSNQKEKGKQCENELSHVIF